MTRMPLLFSLSPFLLHVFSPRDHSTCLGVRARPRPSGHSRMPASAVAPGPVPAATLASAAHAWPHPGGRARPRPSGPFALAQPRHQCPRLARRLRHTRLARWRHLALRLMDFISLGASLQPHTISLPSVVAHPWLLALASCVPGSRAPGGLRPGGHTLGELLRSGGALAGHATSCCAPVGTHALSAGQTVSFG
jgi:hypothetical protein